MPIDRREALLLTGAALVAPSVLAQEAKPEGKPKPKPTSRLITRKIPATGEDVPVIGLGTSGAFDVGVTSVQSARGLPPMLTELDTVDTRVRRMLNHWNQLP